MNTERRHGPPSWTEVAMMLVRDLPALAIIGLVGLLAFKGQAESMHVVLAGFGALLSRSFPRAIQVGGAAVALALVAIASIHGCASVDVEAQRAKNAVDVAAYSTELDTCIARGKDAGSFDVYDACAESLDRKYGRDAGR